MTSGRDNNTDNFAKIGGKKPKCVFGLQFPILFAFGLHALSKPHTISNLGISYHPTL